MSRYLPVSPERAREINEEAERCRAGIESCASHAVALAPGVTSEDVIRAARALVAYYLVTPGLALRFPNGGSDSDAEQLMACLIEVVD